MEKKSYIKPSIKVSVIEAEALMAASGGTVIDGQVNNNQPTQDDDDNQYAKENNFPSVWD